MNTYFKSFSNRAAYEAYENTEDLFIAYIEDTGDVIYINDNPATIPYTITSLEDGATVNTNDCYWSIDSGDTWHLSYITPPTLNTGDSIMFKTNQDGTMRHPSINKQYAVGGNIMSLFYANDYFGSYIQSFNPHILREFYKYDTNIINAHNLIIPDPVPAYEGCFNNMFRECTSLITPPELPATTLANECYREMFQGCTSLTTTPKLPATILATRCYNDMFHGCTSLTTAPELPATTLANSCYGGMFNGCTSLTTIPDLPDAIVFNKSYEWMFANCTSLTTAPKLSFYGGRETILSMFRGCSSLTDVSKVHIERQPGVEWYNPLEELYFECPNLNSIQIYGSEWVEPNGGFNTGAPTGTFTVPAVTNYNPEDYIGNGIPLGWTIVRAS